MIQYVSGNKIVMEQSSLKFTGKALTFRFQAPDTTEVMLKTLKDASGQAVIENMVSQVSSYIPLDVSHFMK